MLNVKSIAYIDGANPYRRLLTSGGLQRFVGKGEASK